MVKQVTCSLPELQRMKQWPLLELLDSHPILTPTLPSPRTHLHMKVLYRGMRELKVDKEFLQNGGTELAALSTTDDLGIAVRYARVTHGSSALIFRIVVPNAMQLGIDLRFVSAFPHECEFLYPPLTVRSRSISNALSGFNSATHSYVSLSPCTGLMLCLRGTHGLPLCSCSVPQITSHRGTIPP